MVNLGGVNFRPKMNGRAAQIHGIFLYIFIMKIRKSKLPKNLDNLIDIYTISSIKSLASEEDEETEIEGWATPSSTSSDELCIIFFSKEDPPLAYEISPINILGTEFNRPGGLRDQLSSHPKTSKGLYSSTVKVRQGAENKIIGYFKVGFVPTALHQEFDNLKNLILYKDLISQISNLSFLERRKVKNIRTQQEELSKKLLDNNIVPNVE